MTVNWIIKPLSPPAVLRNCTRCGCIKKFRCSGKFRVNAQKKSLDVWLIYHCETCEDSWNMTILSRVRPQEIDSALYTGFLENDAPLSLGFALDPELHRRNGVRTCYDDVAYVIEGDELTMDMLHREDITLCISSPYNLNLRLDKLLRDKLGLSRARLEACLRRGEISCTGTDLSAEKPRLMLKGDMLLHISQVVADFHSPAASMERGRPMAVPTK